MWDADAALEELIASRERMACPDCDIRGDLNSYPDVTQGKPLKVRQGRHSFVKKCICRGKGWVRRGSV